MKTEPWNAQPVDQRGRRIVLLSHCLLNENTRYPGGAPRSGPIPEIVQACVDRGIGVVQLPCPEAQVWGGIAKRRLLTFWGARGTIRYRAGLMCLPLLVLRTRFGYWRLARSVARQIRDYVDAGIDVLGVVGVDASPSCGVTRTIHLRRSFEALGALDPYATSADVNQIIRHTVVEGQGLFVRTLKGQLAGLGIAIPFAAHDLIRELDGLPTSVDLSSLGKGT